MTIHRITLFNIPKPEDVDILLAEYRTLAQEAKKVHLTHLLLSTAPISQILTFILLIELRALHCVSPSGSHTA